ncbi:hypothetical protein [Gryllotalpicola daejeonensis]
MDVNEAREGFERRHADRETSNQIVLERLRAAGYEADLDEWLTLKEPLTEAETAVVLELMHDQALFGYSRNYLARGLERATKTVSFDELIELYLGTDDPSVEEGLASAIEVRAKKIDYPKLVALVTGEHAGRYASAFFLRKVRRYGGEEGRKILKSLVDDPEYGWTAHHLLTGRERKPQ